MAYRNWIVASWFPAALTLGCGNAASSTAPAAEGGLPDAAHADAEAGAEAIDGSQEPGDAHANADSADAGAERLQISWAACDTLTDGGGPAAECATVEVPLDWAHPEGARTPLFLKRIRATQSPARAQAWFLPGGPGSSSVGFEKRLAWLSTQRPDIDLYTWDHRGTGRSARLGCPDQEASTSRYGASIGPIEFRQCANWLKANLSSTVRFMNPDMAALDLREVISATRAGTQDVLVYGLSYGSLLVQRYLQVAPSQATGVALDGVFSPRDRKILTVPNNWTQTTRDYFALCEANGSCVANAGGGLSARMDALLADVDTKCPAFRSQGNANIIRAMVIETLTSWKLRPLLLALIVRLERCSPEDKVALNVLASTLFPSPAPPPSTAATLTSYVLLLHFSLSERMPVPPPDPQEYWLSVEGAYVDPTEQMTMLEVLNYWPTYSTTAATYEIPVPTVPVLLVQGTLDPRTVLAGAQDVKSAMGAQATFAPIAGGVHGLLFPSASNRDPEDPTNACGDKLLLEFLDHPSRVDTSCVASVAPVDFDTDDAVKQKYLGTTNLWK